MANNRWLGKAANVRQVDTITIANTWAQNDTVTVTIDSVDFVITIGTLVTTTQVATTVKEALNGTTLTDTSASYNVYGGAIPSIPQFKDLVATSSSAVVTVTQNTTSFALYPGKPFTMSVTESTTGSGTATAATATAATGKHHANAADNWSDGAPTDNDDLIFDDGAVDCLYNLTLSCQPASITVTKGYTGRIGLAAFNADNAGYVYKEYRERYLTTDDNSVAANWYIGTGDGTGSQRVNIAAGAGQTNIYVYGNGTREVQNVPPVLVKGTHASNVLSNLAGDVGFAFQDDESGHLATVRNGTNKNSQTKCVVGKAVDLDNATIVNEGGYLETRSQTSTSSSIAVHGGEMVIMLGGQLTAAVYGGVLKYRAAGTTLGTLAVGPDGEFVKDMSSTMTITNVVQLHKGAKFRATNGTITLSAGYKLNQCRPADVTVDVGPDRTYTVA